MGILIVPLVGLTCATAGAALAAALAGSAPAAAAGLIRPVLCPAGASSARIVAPSADVSSSNGAAYVLKCFNGQGVELAGNGDSFTALWWSGWMVSSGVVGALACIVLLVVLASAVLRGLRSRAGESHRLDGSAWAGGAGDPELDELQRLEAAGRDRQK